MNLSMKQKQTRGHKERTCGCQGGGLDGEVGVGRYKLSYIKWINSKVLLYGSGNYIQYPVIIYSRKEY